MKIFTCPAEIPAPSLTGDWRAAEDKHTAQLKAWLLKAGYTGPYTGEIYKEHVADGYALYMVGDNGAKSCLIHLPYGDAYQARDVQYVPKKEIFRRIDADKKFRELWAKK